jgi:choice-of-anchor B domain-containing protein
MNGTRLLLLVPVAVVWLARLDLVSRQVIAVPEPPGGTHCACDAGICRIDANGRACSCGCAQRADVQPLQNLGRLLDAPCTDGMAGPFPCRDVDLLAFLPHATTGTGNGNDLWGWTDPQTGREYALVGRTTGTAFVDISRPREPIYLGYLPTHTVDSIWRGIKVFADHAFIVSEAPDHGMQIFDLRRLRTVASPPARFTETAHYAGFGSTHTLALNTQTGFAYAVGTRTCEGGLHVVDVRTPAAPGTAGCFSLDGYTHETQCVVYAGPDTTYRDREICFNSNEDTLTIVDVTDKQAQNQVSRTGYGGSAYTHQGWLTEDQRFFLVNDEGDERAFGHPTRTWIWDVSDLDEPTLAAQYNGPVPAIDHNLYIRGDLVYESNYRSGLRVLDASSIATGLLREVGFFDVYPDDDAPAFNGAWTSYPFFASGAVVVNGIEQGLFVLRPRAEPRGHPTGLSVAIGEPGEPAETDRDWIYVVRVSNHGPAPLREARVIHVPPSGARLISARPSLGRCDTGASAACDLGELAAGSDAFVIVTVRPSGERDFVSTATVTARSPDGAVREASAIATTRGVRLEPRLDLRRPSAGTVFWIGRNNTVQWNLAGVAGSVRIDLSRDDGATWATLTDEAPNTGFFDWAPTGVGTPRARIRVTSLTQPSLARVSPTFTIATR